jgi:rubredoxin
MNIAEINPEGSVPSGHGKSTAPISEPEDLIATDAAPETMLPNQATVLSPAANPSPEAVPPLVASAAVSPATEGVPSAAPSAAKTDLPPDATPPLPSVAADAKQAPATKEFACPNCGHIARVGEWVCTNCQFVFGASISTHRIEETEVPQPSRPQQTGDAIATEEKPITLEIDGTVLNLSIHETLIVGRRVVGEEPPDVDLTPFRAEEQGVSRRHLRLSRRGSLIYITDLHSTNRTYLNGRKLIPDGDRLIRSGDEIRLGRLKIKVRF